MRSAVAQGRWLLLVHQVPPKPNYFRVKIWRRLQRLGAVGIKNSVYVLPKSEQAQEDFQWVLREIVNGGGDALVCEARFVDGLSDDQVEALFRSARDADYAEIVDDARRLAKRRPATPVRKGDRRKQTEANIAKLRRRLMEVAAIDFFGASGRDTAEGLLAALEARGRAPDGATGAALQRVEDFRGRTWVTRKGLYIDRIACAWLIRRMIDPRARFKFVAGKGYRPQPEEQRFDMFEAEFTHQGDRCSFEVFIDRFHLEDPALRPIAEIVHDIDLKDAKFARPEAAGLERLIAGIAMAHDDDQARMARGSAVFDDLYAYFRRKPS